MNEDMTFFLFFFSLSSLSYIIYIVEREGAPGGGFFQIYSWIYIFFQKIFKNS